MIISPPFLRDKDATQSDADWIEAMMPVNARRGYPLNASESWHGGIHISHTDAGITPEKVRAIADGTVVSFRKPSPPEKRDQFPLKYAPVRGTDDGYVLLKHETEIGSGEDGKVVFYSLYMHLKFLEAEIKADAKIYRKDPLGSSGMTDGQNEFHLQVFCDDDTISKLTGRKTKELDISKDGRTDAVYGDIHFYLPAGTTFYDKAPANNSTSTTGISERYTSNVPLYVSMTLAQGNCTMVTRQKNTQIDGKYDLLGEPLVNADGEDYEYNLYHTAMRNYTESPSAGFELLRFGRVINTDNETLVPADAPLWMTVSYPGGTGVVNLADPGIKKFSDADFPHWTGWLLVDDDNDTHSQCNSAIIRKLQEEGSYEAQSNRLVCCLPFEWEKSTIDARYKWLMTGLPWEQCTPEKTAIWQVPGSQESNERTLMSEEDYSKFKQHAEALCFDSGSLGSRRLWHFNPVCFIEHMRRCGWLGKEDVIKLVRRNEESAHRPNLTRSTLEQWIESEGTHHSEIIRPANIKNIMPKILSKYCIVSPLRIAHFFGQMARETGRFEFFVEKGDDSYFDKYEPSTPEGRKLGNIHVGDGVKFKGRGAVHLTGRHNYANYSVFRLGPQHRGMEHYTILPNNTSPVTDAYTAFDAAGYYWSSKQKYSTTLSPLGKLGINYWADKGAQESDASEVTRRINPGRDGFLTVRWPAFIHAWHAINDEIKPPENYRSIK
jgi:predicted chitinase